MGPNPKAVKGTHCRRRGWRRGRGTGLLQCNGLVRRWPLGVGTVEAQSSQSSRQRLGRDQSCRSHPIPTPTREPTAPTRSSAGSRCVTLTDQRREPRDQTTDRSNELDPSSRGPRSLLGKCDKTFDPTPNATTPRNSEYPSLSRSPSSHYCNCGSNYKLQLAPKSPPTPVTCQRQRSPRRPVSLPPPLPGLREARVDLVN